MIDLRVIGLPRFFVLTVSVFWSAWGSKIVVVSNKGIAKMSSVRAFFLQRKSQLFVHLLGTRTLLRMNIGYFRKPYTAFGIARATGTKRSTPSYAPSALSPMPMIHASTLVLYGILLTRWRPSLLSLCPSVSTSTTLYISLKIRQLKHTSNSFYRNVSKSTLWDWLTGFLVFIFRGVSLLRGFTST